MHVPIGFAGRFGILERRAAPTCEVGAADLFLSNKKRRLAGSGCQREIGGRQRGRESKVLRHWFRTEASVLRY